MMQIGMLLGSSSAMEIPLRRWCKTPFRIVDGSHLYQYIEIVVCFSQVELLLLQSSKSLPESLPMRVLMTMPVMFHEEKTKDIFKLGSDVVL